MRIRAALALAAAPVLLAACTTGEPSFGDRLLSEGQETRQLGERWVEGERLIARGESLVEKGQKDVRRGNDRIEKGQDLIARGRRLMDTAEQRYRATASGT